MQSLSKNSVLLWRQIQSGLQSSRLYTPVKKPSEKPFSVPNNWEILGYFLQWFEKKITNLSFILRKILVWRNLYTLFWYPLRQQSFSHSLTFLLRYVFVNVSYVLWKNLSPIFSLSTDAIYNFLLGWWIQYIYFFSFVNKVDSTCR